MGHGIALELDNPFDESTDHINHTVLIHQMHEKLVAAIHYGQAPAATLAPDAVGTDALLKKWKVKHSNSFKTALEGGVCSQDANGDFHVDQNAYHQDSNLPLRSFESTTAGVV